MAYKTTITSISIHREDESPIFDEAAIQISIDDEAGGAFLVLKDGQGGKCSIDFSQWETVKSVVKKLMAQKFEGRE